MKRTMIQDKEQGAGSEVPENPPEMPEKIFKPVMAVFGGSFDPVHNGHLFIAGTLLRRRLAEEVLLVPASDPPHKHTASLATGEHRMAMLELAVKPYCGLSVSNIELSRGDQPSYTIETMEMMKHIFDQYDLRFVMGMDSLRDLHKWHRSGELVAHFDFYIYPRPEVRRPSHAELNPHFGPRNARKLLNSILEMPEMPLAATYIRETVQNGECLAGLTSESVIRYIREHNLYKLSPAHEAAG